jgi:hypothetical protein
MHAHIIMLVVACILLVGGGKIQISGTAISKTRFQSSWREYAPKFLSLTMFGSENSLLLSCSCHCPPTGPPLRRPPRFLWLRPPQRRRPSPRVPSPPCKRRWRRKFQESRPNWPDSRRSMEASSTLLLSFFCFFSFVGYVLQSSCVCL